MSDTTLLAISQLRRDGGTQPRDRIDPALIEEYAAQMQRGDKFPPIQVVHDGTNYWVTDGYHRIAANERLGHTEIDCEVLAGTQRDAKLKSCTANTKHGARRTNADKRRAVMVLLEDPEWQHMSDNDIAKRCDVSHTYVANLRHETCNVASETEIQETAKPRTYTNKHGTKATMNTAKIGKKPAEASYSSEMPTGKVEAQRWMREQRLRATSQPVDEMPRPVEVRAPIEKIVIDPIDSSQASRYGIDAQKHMAYIHSHWTDGGQYVVVELMKLHWNQIQEWFKTHPFRSQA